jgi:hypothetical protein
MYYGTQSHKAWNYISIMGRFWRQRIYVAQLFHDNQEFTPFKFIGWSRRSIENYILSACDNFKPHHQLAVKLFRVTQIH